LTKNPAVKPGILLVNWTWYPSGGDWTYVKSIKDMYEQNGHNVVPFSTNDSRNIKDKYDRYFYNKYQGSSFNLIGLNKNLNELKIKLQKAVIEQNIKAAHLNNLNHYTVNTVLTVLKQLNVPVIWTLHDYKPICSLTSFIRGENRCEKCMGGKFYNSVKYKCKDGNALSSAASAAQNYYFSFRNVYNNADYYICPSEYVRNKFIENGFSENKLITVPHFLDHKPLKNTVTIPEENYIIYFGRVEKLKGIFTLVDAVKQHSDIALKVVGGGSGLDDLKLVIKEQNIKNVEVLGFRDHKYTMELVKKSKFAVVPSHYSETFGFTALEAMLQAKAVIASDSGALGEFVLNGTNGLTYSHDNTAELARLIRMLYDNKPLRDRLGSNAYDYAESYTDKNRYYNSLNKLWNSLKVNSLQ